MKGSPIRNNIREFTVYYSNHKILFFFQLLRGKGPGFIVLKHLVSDDFILITFIFVFCLLTNMIPFNHCPK